MKTLVYNLFGIGAALFMFNSASALEAPTGILYFQRNCASCHTVSDDVAPKVGPGLFGVVGRKVGSAAKFRYSKALVQANQDELFWTDENLSNFLKDPQKSMPGTAMPVKVSNDADRAALLGYLKSLKK